MRLSWGQALSLATLTLNVTPVVAKIGRSIGSGIESEASQIVGDLKNEFDNFEQEVESELSKALVGSNGVLAQFTMEHQTTPPISAQLITSGIQSNVTVGLYCQSCSGASQPAAFAFASQNYSGWNNSWLGFALDNFEALFEIDVDLSAVANGELTLSLLKIPAASDGVVVEVEFQLYLVADASAEMSFTAGLNLTLTEPAAIMMPALDPVVQLNKSQRIGFDQDSFVLAPIFNASMPQLDFSMQFSLRTVFSVTVEDINVGALYLDLPAFNLTVDTLTNALSNCQPPPAGTPSDEIYAELIHLNGTLVAELSYEILDGDDTGIIDAWTIWDPLDKCYAFFPGLGSVGAVPDSSKSPLLTAAAITKCTTGGTTTASGTAAVGAALKSLSPGAKAGAVIGTLVGVALITALAWFGGRASLRHSIKNGGNGSTWTMPRPRSGKFFSRGNRGGATEFSPVSQSTPAWGTTSYEGGVFPNPNTKTQPQFAHQSRQMAKKEPSVTVNEAVTPAPTYVSLGDEFGMPTAATGKTDTMRYDTGPRPAMHEGVRAEQVEGLGLLQSERRPAVQRKDISRKSVPGHGNGRGSL